MPKSTTAVTMATNNLGLGSNQAHIKAHIEALNDRSKTESIQGEYGKYQQMTTWQRIKFNFKSALGF